MAFLDLIVVTGIVRKSKLKLIRSSFDLMTIPKFVHQTSLAIVPGEFGPPRSARKGVRLQIKKALQNLYEIVYFVVVKHIAIFIYVFCF